MYTHYDLTENVMENFFLLIFRASTAEKAAYYFDAALAARSADTRGRESHLLFTIHVYQYSVNGPTGASGGRSRLHLIDFGGKNLIFSNFSSIFINPNVSLDLTNLLE